MSSRRSNVHTTIIDDLAGMVVLGEKIQLLGNLRRVFPDKPKGNATNREYRHGILFEVNNILRSRPPDYQMPECIGAVLESKCASIDVRTETSIEFTHASIYICELREHVWLEYHPSDRRHDRFDCNGVGS